jgi:hypothetical protein
MTQAEQKSYETGLDYDDFADSYFAPRRLLIGINGEFPGIIARRDTFAVSLLGQFDLTDSGDSSAAGNAETIHSQYFVMRYIVPILNRFELDTDGVLEILEDAEDLNRRRWAAAASVEAAWLPPTAIPDRLSLAYRWSSGKREDAEAARAFSPLSSVSQGNVLKAKLSGLSFFRGAYTARLHKNLSIETSALYFLRTDTTSFTDWELRSASPFLGTELYMAASWVPVSDISFTLGGGTFLPGPAFRPEAKPRWLISLGSIVSF